MVAENYDILGCFHVAPNSADRLFDGLSVSAQRSLAKIRNIKRIKKQKIVWHAGERPGIYVLISGRAEEFVFNPLNGRNIARSVARNEIFGIAETIGKIPAKTSLKTLTQCDFIFIDPDDFIIFLNRFPELSFRLLHQLGLNLDKTYKEFCFSTF